MNFVDKVTVSFIAGKGGDGRRSFRRERFISKGGPDGGDGGHGGDVVLRASQHQNTLSAFRYQKQLRAKDGLPGGRNKRHGRSGERLVVVVPVGTEVKDGDKLLADLTNDSQEAIVAKGGKGGFGNAHFTSSIRQAPNFAEKGQPGERLEASLELKLIADVGIVGLPNAGKSTLLSRLSNARPAIDSYPFTTVMPNLGVVDIDQATSILMADIPGLIEGASSGKGLGHEFLRHIERTRLIIHLIDIYEEPAISYRTIRGELKAYGHNLPNRPELVVLNKIDGLDKKIINKKQAQLKKVLEGNTKLITISAQAGTNLNELKFTLKDVLASLSAEKPKEAKPKVPRITLLDHSPAFKVIKVKNGYKVSGQKIEEFAERTDFSNPEAIARLTDILRRSGILQELSRQGLEAGESIYIGEGAKQSFIY